MQLLPWQLGLQELALSLRQIIFFSLFLSFFHLHSFDFGVLQWKRSSPQVPLVPLVGLLFAVVCGCRALSSFPLTLQNPPDPKWMRDVGSCGWEAACDFLFLPHSNAAHCAADAHTRFLFLPLLLHRLNCINHKWTTLICTRQCKWESLSLSLSFWFSSLALPVMAKPMATQPVTLSTDT